MNHYELLAIISGKYAENELEDITKKIDDLLEKFAGKTHYVQHMGRKKLAYPIKHLHYGYYVVYEFDSEPHNVSKLNRELRLSSDLLRHCIFRKDEVGAPKQFTERKESENRTQSEIPAELRGVFSQEAVPSATPEIAVTPEAATPPATEDTSATPVSVPTAPVSPTSSEDTAPIEATPPAPSITPEEKIVPEKEEEKAPALPAEEVKEKEEIPTPAEERPIKKKKDERASYEDLDKKLDELLKNDIL